MARVVVGIQPVREAIRAHGSRLLRVVVDPGAPAAAAVARFARDRGVAVEESDAAQLEKLAAGVRHQGAAAIAPELEVLALDDVELAPAAVVVALDGITDPQNFGAVIRSSVALGASLVVWPENSAAPLSA